MQIDRRLVGFGLFLITVGGVMVAVRQGLIGEADARRALTLWPLILVGTGLSIVLAGRPGAWLGGGLLALTFGAMLGGVAATGVFPTVGLCGGDRGHGTAFGDRGGTLGSSAHVTVKQDCGDLTIGTVAGSTWNVTGESGDGRPPRIDGASASLRITSPDDSVFDLGGTSHWNLVVPRDPSIDLEVTVNGGQSNITLEGATVDTFQIDANAGSVDLDLREIAAIRAATIDVNFGSVTLRLPNRSLTAAIAANAASVAICAPAGAGLRFELDSAAASNDFASHGLVQTGKAWATPGYAEATVRLEIQVDVNAGSIALDPARQCAG